MAGERAKILQILDHSDHKSSGRALIFVSVSYILLDQCSVNFSDALVLGIKVKVSKDELQWMFGALSWLFLVIFLVKAMPNIGKDTYYFFEKQRDEQYEATLLALQSRDHRITKTYVQGDEEISRVQKEYRREALYYSKRAKALAKGDYLLVWLLEVLPPILFFILTFVSLQSVVCLAKISEQGIALPVENIKGA